MNKSHIKLWSLFLVLSPAFAATTDAVIPAGGFQLFNLFILSLGGFIVVQMPMLLVLVSLWIWTLYMEYSRKEYPNEDFLEKKLYTVQDFTTYIFLVGEFGTFCGIWIALLQLGRDKSAFGLALGMAISTSILGKLGQIIGRGPERRLSVALKILEKDEYAK